MLRLEPMVGAKDMVGCPTLLLIMLPYQQSPGMGLLASSMERKGINISAVQPFASLLTAFCQPTDVHA